MLLDEFMPVLDGLGFLKALRSLPQGTEPKVLFCMIEKDDRRIALARHAGADEYMLKPFDEQLVAAKLKQMGLV